MKTTLRQMPLLAPSICYALGILIAFYGQHYLWLLAIPSFFIGFIILLWNASLLKSFAVTIVFISMGISNQYFFTHRSQCLSCEGLLNKNIQLDAVIDSETKVNGSMGSVQFIVNVKQLGNIRLQSNLKDTITEILLIGDHLQLIGHLKSINLPNSPRQFDYKQYLQHKGIYYGFEIDNIYKKPESINSLRRYAQQVKIVCKRIMETYITNKNAKQICLAMTLGEKKSMDDDLIKSFRDTGTAHYMAVSGLHVDLVAMLLLYGFGFIKCRWVGFKLTKYLCYISFIWSYALLVGMSPSVMRAATMFTFYSFGRIFMLPTNTWNILCLTVIILLIYCPSFLFDVGFQLSFIAVVSIVLYSPYLLRSFGAKSKILNKCLAAIKVTLAVQILIFPLNLYYFHQFPLNFILANSFLWLFALILIYGSIYLIVISYVSKMAATLTGWFLGMTSDILQYCLALIQNFDSLILKDVWLSKMDLIVIYMFIGCMSWCVIRISKTSLICLIISIALLAELYIYHQDTHQSTAAIYVYRTYPTYRIDLMFRDNCYTYSPNKHTTSRAVENNRSFHSVKHVHELDGFGCHEDAYFWNYKNAIGFFGLNILIDDTELISNYCQYDIIVGSSFKGQKKCTDSSYYIYTGYSNDLGHINIHHLNTQGTFIKAFEPKEIKPQ